MLKRILLKAMLKLGQFLVDILEFLTIEVNFVVKGVVLAFELLVLVSLLGVEVVEARLVYVVDLLDLLLVPMELVFHILLLGKQPVKMGLLFFVLVLDVSVQILDVLRLGVAAVLVQGQVVVS